VCITSTQIVSFWSRVDRSKDCWNWTGCKTHFGHGRVVFTRKEYLTHRLAYVISIGDIPAGMYVCHHCDNPSCVRPTHLFIGSAMDNVRDMYDKGRQHTHQGESHPMAKLKTGEAQLLNKLFGKVSAKNLSKIFKVSLPLVYKIGKGELRKCELV